MYDRILHPGNRERRSCGDVFYPEVEKLIKTIRELEGNAFDFLFFKDLRETADDKEANAKELQLVLGVLVQDVRFQLGEFIDTQKNKELIHNAISGYDAEQDLKINRMRGL